MPQSRNEPAPPEAERPALRRVETRAIVAWLAAAAAGWGFLALGDEMREGDTLALDRSILMVFREPGDPADPIGSRGVQEAMRDVTALGGVTVLTLVTVVAALTFLLHGKRRHALILVVSALVAQLVSGQLKRLYDRPRPDLVPHGVYIYSASFPSGHSMLSGAIYLTLAMLIASLEPRRAMKALAFTLALLLMVAVGVSRVYLAVHWPSDVLAGWCAGAAVALIAWFCLIGLGGGRVPDETPPQ
jgi:undecaprenyl-diphosphatase